MATINTAITLQDLPPPPPGKIGWPWTEQTQPLPNQMSDGSEWPPISIVTPSYNQGKFIEETIRSILLQGYPNLEYIIIDGGSTDNTIDIIKKYARYITYWISEPDRGQSHALNKGFYKATGQLIGWQNADDYYQVGAFNKTAQILVDSESDDIFYGSIYMTDEEGKVIDILYLDELQQEEMFPWFKLHNEAMFFRRKVLDEGHFINESFQHYMDYEFFWQLILADYKFKAVPGLFAFHRKHIHSKSSRQHYISAKELFEIYKIAFAYPNLSDNGRKKLRECSKSLCLDNFLKLRLDLFRSSFYDLISMFGIKILDQKLMIKYFLSFLGKDILRFIMTQKSRMLF